VVIAFFGGLYHWWPKMFGRMYSERWGRIGCVLMFLGFNLTFIPQFMMGAMGMPRRYFNYAEGFGTYHVVSSLGSFFMGFAMLLVAANLIHSLFRGKKAPANPWGAATFEWMTSSPPPHENFVVSPDPDDSYDPYEYRDMEYDEAEENWSYDPAPPWREAMKAGGGA
jgi:cytochrome c oxidase subunit 1